MVKVGIRFRTKSFDWVRVIVWFSFELRVKIRVINNFLPALKLEQW